MYCCMRCQKCILPRIALPAVELYSRTHVLQSMSINCCVGLGVCAGLNPLHLFSLQLPQLDDDYDLTDFDMDEEGEEAKREEL